MSLHTDFAFEKIVYCVLCIVYLLQIGVQYYNLLFASQFSCCGIIFLFVVFHPCVTVVTVAVRT